MAETMGDIIRKLRRSRNLTQEELAAFIGVTSQAVSKWENNTGMPDISQIVPLANLFCVSIDTLFNYCLAEQKNELDKYKTDSLRLRNFGCVADVIALWREAVKKFPGNYDCLLELARALHSSLYNDEFKVIRESSAAECVGICERLLSDCTDAHIKEETIEILCYLYSNEQLSIANEEKAVFYAKKAGCIWQSTEILLESAYFADNGMRKKIKSENILSFTEHICMSLYLVPSISDEERIRNCHAALALWNTLIPDGNFLFYHCRIASIYKYLAYSYAKMQKYNETLDALELAAYHSKASDNLPCGEQYFTSPFVLGASSDRAQSTKNYTETEYELFLKGLQNSCYDFVRKDRRFQTLCK